MHGSDVLSYFDLLSYHRYPDARRHKRTLALPRGQELPPSKLRATRHDSPVLIFDELKRGLLLRAVGGLLRAAGGPAAIWK